jgi:hypothetical protein
MVAKNGPDEKGEVNEVLERRDRVLPAHRARYQVYTRDYTDGSLGLGWRPNESEELELPGDDLRVNGFGELKSAGFGELEERVRLEDMDPGEYVGEITIDVEEWSHAVEIAPDVPLENPSLLERVERRLAGWFR